jgi:hypothetical protein
MKRNIMLFVIFIGLLFVAIKFFIMPGLNQGKDKTPVVSQPGVEKVEDVGKEIQKEPVVSPEPPKDEEEKVIYTDGEPFNEEDSVFEYDKTKYFMDGKREKAEVKLNDYSYLLKADVKEFEPKIPTEWTKDNTQIDKIEGYFDMTVESRMEKMKIKENFTEEEMEEWRKINEINIQMNNAYSKGDYHTYVKNMYKGWREFHGITKAGMIESKTIYEEMLVFFPEKVDLKIGYAYGYYFRQVAAMTPIGPGEMEIWDGMIMYKQNDKGAWEVYYELPFQMDY